MAEHPDSGSPPYIGGQWIVDDNPRTCTVPLAEGFRVGQNWWIPISVESAEGSADRRCSGSPDMPPVSGAELVGGASRGCSSRTAQRSARYWPVRTTDRADRAGALGPVHSGRHRVRVAPVTVVRVASRSSTRPSATSTATSSSCSRPTTWPNRPAATSSPSPSSSITGYPPEDLVLKPGFVADNRGRPRALRRRTPARCAAVVGFVDADRDLLQRRRRLRRRARSLGTYRKRLLPNYAVFDEAALLHARQRDRRPRAVRDRRRQGRHLDLRGHLEPVRPARRPGRGRRRTGVNINGSPYHCGQGRLPRADARRRGGRRRTRALVYVNQVGGQDELVFDGGSFVFDAEGELLARRRQFDEELLVVDVPIAAIYRQRLLDPRGRESHRRAARSSSVTPEPVDQADGRLADPVAEPLDSDRRAVPGARARHARLLPQERLHRRRDRTVRAASTRRSSPCSPSTRSGPITCTACRCRRATRRDHSQVRRRDAGRQPRHRLPHDLDRAGVRGLPRHARPELRRTPAGADRGEHAEPVPRRRLLMALSNEFGWMVLTTGNKSEMAVGYFTIYGDSVGGYAVIKDVLKTQVYELCRYVNARAGVELIPEDVITKPPSAELRPDQRDDQSLPPYDGARPDPRAVRGGRSHGRRDRRARLRRGRRAAHHPARRHRRVQAAPVPTRGAGHHARRSVAIAACRSPTATGADDALVGATPTHGARAAGGRRGARPGRLGDCRRRRVGHRVRRDVRLAGRLRRARRPAVLRREHGDRRHLRRDADDGDRRPIDRRHGDRRVRSGDARRRRDRRGRRHRGVGGPARRLPHQPHAGDRARRRAGRGHRVARVAGWVPRRRAVGRAVQRLASAAQGRPSRRGGHLGHVGRAVGRPGRRRGPAATA